MQPPQLPSVLRAAGVPGSAPVQDLQPIDLGLWQCNGLLQGHDLWQGQSGSAVSYARGV